MIPSIDTALMELSRGLQQKQLQDEQNQLATAYAQNPAYMNAETGIQNNNINQRKMQLAEQEIQREQQRKDALRQLASRFNSGGFSTGGINPNAQQPMSALDLMTQGAVITGDLSDLNAFNLALAKQQNGIDTPASLRQVEWYLNATPEQRSAYDRVNKVGVEKIDRGDSWMFVDKNTGQVVSEVKKELSPENQPKNIEQGEAAKLRGKFMEEARLNLPKVQRSLQDAQLRNQNITRVAQQVSQTAQNAFTTGFTGSIMNSVAGSPAFDLKNNLQTLEATAAFDTLQNMRDNSPTGGALGAVTEKELELLKSAYSNLANSQSYEQFVQNLEAFNRQNEQSLRNAQAAYEQDYNRYNGAQDPFLPTPEETITPTNTTTQPTNTKTIKWGDF